jgi:hypothetical protein
MLINCKLSKKKIAFHETHALLLLMLVPLETMTTKLAALRRGPWNFLVCLPFGGVKRVAFANKHPVYPPFFFVRR